MWFRHLPRCSIELVTILVMLFGLLDTYTCSNHSKPVHATKQKSPFSAKNHTFNVVINSSSNGGHGLSKTAIRKKDLDTLLSREILAKVKSLKTNCNCRKSPTQAPAPLSIEKEEASKTATSTPANNTTIPLQTISIFLPNTAIYPVPHLNTTTTTSTTTTLAPVSGPECPKCCFCVYCSCKCPNACKVTTTTVVPTITVPTYPVPPPTTPYRPDCGCIPMIQPCFVCPCSQSCQPVPSQECPCQVDHSQPYICPAVYNSAVWNTPVEDVNQMRQLMGQGYRYLDMVNSSNPCGQPGYPVEPYHVMPPSPYPGYPLPPGPQYPIFPSGPSYIPSPPGPGYMPSPGSHVPIPPAPGYVPSPGGYAPSPGPGYMLSPGGGYVKPVCVHGPGGDVCYPPPKCSPQCPPLPWPQPPPCHDCPIPPVYPTKWPVPPTQKSWTPGREAQPYPQPPAPGAQPWPMPPAPQPYQIGPQPPPPSPYQPGYPTLGPVWPYPPGPGPQPEHPQYAQASYASPPTPGPGTTEEPTTLQSGAMNVRWSGWMQGCVLLILAALPLGLLLV